MGTDSVVGGLVGQIKPFFLVPAVAMAGFGAVLAVEVAIGIAVVHLSAVAVAIYIAHLVDTYVDYYLRGEDSTVSLSRTQLAIAIVASSLGFFLLVATLWSRGGSESAVITVPLWLLAVTHAPLLDRNPITGTLGYPLGIALAFVGGYAGQTGEISPEILLVATSYLGILSGCKIMMDQRDYEADASISKRTVPVLVGRPRAKLCADGLVVAGVTLIVGGTVSGLFGPLAALASAFPVLALLVARYETALSPVMVVGLSLYPFSALLFGSMMDLFP